MGPIWRRTRQYGAALSCQLRLEDELAELLRRRSSSRMAHLSQLMGNRLAKSTPRVEVVLRAHVVDSVAESLDGVSRSDRARRQLQVTPTRNWHRPPINGITGLWRRKRFAALKLTAAGNPLREWHLTRDHGVRTIA